MILNLHNFLSILLACGYAAVVYYFRNGWQRVPAFSVAPAPDFRTKISVLIAARNEEDKLAATITDLLAQDYPASLTEIIIIDDHSTDATSSIVLAYADRGVRLIQLNEAHALNSYKKKAIATGIAGAGGELMVTTDADCRFGPRWLSTIAAYYETHTVKMISAPVVFFEEKGLFERLQALEFLYLIGLGGAMIGNRNPTTCNGANFAYTKAVFNEVGGFSGIEELASGDDELLLHKVGALYPDQIGFCKSESAIVRTHAKSTLKSFMTQRKRWASKTVKYKNRSMVHMGVFIWIFNCSLLVNLLLALIFPASRGILLSMYLIKLVAEICFLRPVTRFAGRSALISLMPFLSVIHTVYFVIIGLAGNSGKYVWKGRMVK